MNDREQDVGALVDALRGLDEPIAWITENYPSVMEAMPSEAFRKIKAAGEALATWEQAT